MEQEIPVAVDGGRLDGRYALTTRPEEYTQHHACRPVPNKLDQWGRGVIAESQMRSLER